MKKLFYSAVFLIVPNLHAANPTRYVQISTNAVTQQTGSYNVVSGSVTTLNAVRISSFGASGLAIKGTQTNDSAVAGDVGEYLSSACTNAGYPATAVTRDFAKITVTPGEWDLGMGAYLDASPGKTTDCVYGVSATQGNTFTDGVSGQNKFEFNIWNSSFAFLPEIIPTFRVLTNATTDYYLKGSCTYSGSAPTITGYIRGRRMR